MLIMCSAFNSQFYYQLFGGSKRKIPFSGVDEMDPLIRLFSANFEHRGTIIHCSSSLSFYCLHNGVVGQELTQNLLIRLQRVSHSIISVRMVLNMREAARLGDGKELADIATDSARFDGRSAYNSHLVARDNICFNNALGTKKSSSDHSRTDDIEKLDHEDF